MFNKIADKVKALTVKADLEHAMATTKQIASDSLDAGKSKAANLSHTMTTKKQLASDNLETGKSKVNDFIEQNWPKIENMLINSLLTVTEEKLKDDATLEVLLGKAYEVLPIVVRLVLPREKFVEFSMKKRDSLLLKLQEHKNKEGGSIDERVPA